MSLRHALLGLLARQPATGYELARLFDRSLRTTWAATHSQVYPELARLLEAGLVEVVARGARGSKTYAVTSEGRAELRRWLVEQPPDRSQRNESGVRLFLTPLLPPADRLAAYRRDLADVEAQLHELEGVREVQRERRSLPVDPFEPQVELGLRLQGEIRAWLLEQVDAAEAELARDSGRPPQQERA